MPIGHRRGPNSIIGMADPAGGVTTEMMRAVQDNVTKLANRVETLEQAESPQQAIIQDHEDTIFEGRDGIRVVRTPKRVIISMAQTDDRPEAPQTFPPPVIVAPFDGANPENVTSKTLSSAVIDPPVSQEWHTLTCSIPITAGALSDVYSNFISTSVTESWDYSLGQLGPEQAIVAGALYFTYAWVRFNEAQDVIDYLILYPCVTYLPHKTTTEITVVTDYRVDTANRKLQKKTLSIRVVATGSESDWLDVHTGSECV